MDGGVVLEVYLLYQQEGFLQVLFWAFGMRLVLVGFGLVVILLLDLLPGGGADSQPPEHKVDQAGEELPKGDSIDDPGLEHVKGGASAVDGEKEELEGHQDVAEEDGEVEEEVGAGLRDDQFSRFAMENVLIDDMP